MIAGQSGCLSRSSSRKFVMKVETLEVCAGMLSTRSLLPRDFSALTHGKEVEVECAGCRGDLSEPVGHSSINTIGRLGSI